MSIALASSALSAPQGLTRSRPFSSAHRGRTACVVPRAAFKDHMSSTFTATAAGLALLANGPVHASDLAAAVKQAPTEVMQIAGSITLGNNEPYDASGGRNDRLGTPLSGARTPPGQALSGDEAKIREAREELEKERATGQAEKGGYSKTNTLLDPYGKEDSTGTKKFK